MSIFALFMIWFFAARVLGRRTRRMRRAYLGLYGPGIWLGSQQLAQLKYIRHGIPTQMVPSPPVAPQPSPFEQLKTRYVNGDITDEQYENELDALLKTPEGRRLVN